MKYILIILVGVCFFIGYFYFPYVKTTSLLNVDLKSIQPGDLVFSVGKSLKSDMVRMLDSNSDITYSHVGLVLGCNNGTIYIVHMSIDKGYIVCETIQDFIQTSNSVELGFYRLRAPPDKGRLYHIIDSLVEMKKKFDRTFDLSNDEEYYCSEMVYKVLKKVNPNIYKGIQYHRYLYPADLINDSMVIEIKKVKL